MLLIPKWHNLRNRIIAWSFIPTTIILLAVALVTFYAYQRVTEDLVIGRNQELTRLSADRLATSLRQYSDVLANLERISEMHTNSPAVQRAALSGARNRLAVFDAGVVILDTRGRVVAAEPQRPEILGKDWSDRGYFRQMIRSPGPTFSDVLPDGPGGAEVVVVSVPIIGNQGQFQGTIAGMFRLGAEAVSSFYGGIVKLRIGESGQTYVVDSNGRAIYHSDHELTGEDVRGRAAAGQVLERKVGSVQTTDTGGGEILASFAPVPGTPWGLVTEDSWDALMSSSRGYQQFLLVLLALGVVVPTLVVTFGVRRITGPIASLIEAAQEVAGGNFGQTITVQTGDELEDLARQFNTMSSKLQESYAQLEQRVADRTRELATINSITAVVSGSLDLEDILHDALDKTMEVMNVEVGGAYRLEDDNTSLTLMAHRGLPPDYVGRATHMTLPLAASLGFAVGEKPSLKEVGDYPAGETRAMLEREGIQLVVSVPLAAKGRLLGIMNVGSKKLRSLTEEELALLAATGQQIGVAMENARLYERAEQVATAAERNRLARDLHDAVSQTLFSASLIAEVLPRLWERNPDEAHRRLEELRQLTRGALAEMRTLLVELRPAALTEAPLGDLLRQLSEAITGRARVPVVVTVEGQRQLPADVQVALYRIAQEALNNVAKHAGAKEAAVLLRCQARQVHLEVTDDGRGFDAGQVSPDHLGLSIMRERADAIGATLKIGSQPGRGTEVTVVWENGQQEEGS